MSTCFNWERCSVSFQRFAYKQPLYILNLVTRLKYQQPSRWAAKMRTPRREILADIDYESISARQTLLFRNTCSFILVETQTYGRAYINLDSNTLLFPSRQTCKGSQKASYVTELVTLFFAFICSSKSLHGTTGR